MNQNKVCITFAGAVGSSKTPITNYISTKINLPVFNNDAIRSEVIEDLGEFDKEEYLTRRGERLGEIMKNRTSFIYDASVDRRWEKLKKTLSKNNYKFFIISLDLSKEFLKDLYEAKGYNESLERLDELVQDHEDFLSHYSDDIGIHISDEDFGDRCEISFRATSEFLQ